MDKDGRKKGNNHLKDTAGVIVTLHKKIRQRCDFAPDVKRDEKDGKYD